MGSRIPQDLQSQPTWAHEGSQTLNHTKQGVWRGSTWAHTHASVTDVQLDLHAGPLTIGAGAVSDSAACHWIAFP